METLYTFCRLARGSCFVGPHPVLELYHVGPHQEMFLWGAAKMTLKMNDLKTNYLKANTTYIIIYSVLHNRIKCNQFFNYKNNVEHFYETLYL